MRVLTLIAATLVTWAACAYYTLSLNPEVTHYAAGAAIKSAWAARMTSEYAAKTVAIGGSSCEFGFDGERMLYQHGLPFVNYGWQAGMGAAVMAESALSTLRAGDTLVVAIEPMLLTVPLDQPSLGVQLSVAAHHPEWVTDPALGVGRINRFQELASLRPGGYHAFTLIGKLVHGDPLYRYHLSDYHASGWKQTSARPGFEGPAWHQVRLSADSQHLLRNLRDWSALHGVRAVYSLPWSYTPPGAVNRFRADNLAFLLQMSQFLPILRDVRLGVDPVREHYADTSLHLNGPGAALRSDELAEQLAQWDIWTTPELERLATR